MTTWTPERIRALIDHEGGAVAVWARRHGIPERTVWQWLDGSQPRTLAAEKLNRLEQRMQREQRRAS